MATYWLRDFAAVSRARRQVRALAERLGADSAAVEQVAAELGCNCVEHRTDGRAARLRCYEEGHRLVVETLNRCAQPPDWETRKADRETRYAQGGRGLDLVAQLAARFRCDWGRRHGVGFVETRAEFPLEAGGLPTP